MLDFKYKVRIVLDENSPIFNEAKKKLHSYLKRLGFSFLPDNEYGIDNHEISVEPFLSLTDEKWFLKSVKEFLYFDSDTGTPDEYNVEDVMEIIREEYL